SQNGTFHLSNVPPLSSNKSATRVGCLDRFAGSVVDQSEHWQIADIQGTIHVRDADVQWRRDGVMAYIGRIVASSARTCKRCRHSRHIIDSGNAGNCDWLRVEYGLPSRNAGSSSRPRVFPSIVQVENIRIEWGSGGIEPKASRKRIVNANEEFLRGQCLWAASCSAAVQKACPIVDCLCSSQCPLEGH